MLLTNLNIHSRLSKGNLYCPLSHNEVESIPHLFFKCQATKLFWFDACWGLRAELLLVHSDFDVVKLIVNPPVSPSSPCFNNQFVVHASAQIALTLEAIWNFRNQQVHQMKPINPIVVLKALEYKIVEHVQAALGELNDLVSLKSYWRPPPTGIIKFNVDSAVLPSSAKITVVVRLESRSLI